MKLLFVRIKHWLRIWELRQWYEDDHPLIAWHLEKLKALGR